MIVKSDENSRRLLICPNKGGILKYKLQDGVSVGCLFLCSAYLNVLFAFVYDNHMDIGWETTVIFPLRVCCLILPSWAMISALFDPFVSRYPRHKFSASQISTVPFLAQQKHQSYLLQCVLVFFEDSKSNHRVHRSNWKLSKASFHTWSMDTLCGIFLPSINTNISANSLIPKALQGYVTTCPDHDLDCNLYRGRL